MVQKGQKLPHCTNGCLTTKGHPKRHLENHCPSMRKKRINEMDFTAEFVALRSPEIPPADSSALVLPGTLQTPTPRPFSRPLGSPSRHMRSPEIPPVDSSAPVIPGTPQTPTPRPSSRPLGSPSRHMRPPIMQELAVDFLDPALEQPCISSESTCVSVTSSIDANTSDNDPSASEGQQALEESADAEIIKIPSKSKGQQKETKRLTSDQVGYEPDNRKRDTYFRNQSDRLRDSVKKLGNRTACYGILYICRNVNDQSKSAEAPVVFTSAIHDNPKFQEVAAECMGKIVTFENEFRASQQQSLWDKEQELRKAQRSIREKEEMLKANAEKMAQDKELIAALEARLAQESNQ